jgi:hypothetical protein
MRLKLKRGFLCVDSDRAENVSADVDEKRAASSLWIMAQVGPLKVKNLFYLFVYMKE